MVDRAKAKLVVDEASALLDDLGKRHGLVLTSKRGSFTGETVNIRFGLVEAESSEDAERKRFREAAGLFGLTVADYGRTFKYHDGATYTVVGIRPKARKRPVLAKSQNGKTYSFPIGLVKLELAKGGGANA